MDGSRSRRSSGTHTTSLCALTGTTHSRTRRAIRPQLAVGLLQSGELKFDQTLAGIRRQLPTSGSLLAKTDNTFEKPCRDGGIRTRGLLLPNQFYPDAGRSRMLPDVTSTSSDAGQT
jgi:hypothetical protein